MIDEQTNAIMMARYIADQIRLGKRTLSAKERMALATGFDACDRQRAEFARRAADLTSEEREVLAMIRSIMAGVVSSVPIDLREHIALLDRLLSTEKP